MNGLKWTNKEIEMKKIAIVVVVGMIASVASADLSIVWKSMGGGITGQSGAPAYLEGSRIDLIYSMDGAITDEGEYNLALADEEILATGFTGGNSLWNGNGVIYYADYTAGVFFTRIYEFDGSVGEYFMDIPMGAGADYIYNALDTATLYADDVVVFRDPALNINENGTTVVPEPATLGLMGVAGLGMFLARRKSRR